MATYAEPIAERRVTTRRADLTVTISQSLLAPAGRALFAAIFIIGGLTQHFSSTAIQYAASQGVPLANLMVPLAGTIAILGGLSILLGFHARVGAWLIVLFLVPVTFTMHQWWAITDPATRAVQQALFMKNIAMLGGALLIAYFGAGAFSVDERHHQILR
jgi:putative oxidoreductase